MKKLKREQIKEIIINEIIKYFEKQDLPYLFKDERPLQKHTKKNIKQKKEIIPEPKLDKQGK